jgi:hypothetical protein
MRHASLVFGTPKDPEPKGRAADQGELLVHFGRVRHDDVVELWVRRVLVVCVVVLLLLLAVLGLSVRRPSAANEAKTYFQPLSRCGSLHRALRSTP